MPHAAQTHTILTQSSFYYFHPHKKKKQKKNGKMYLQVCVKDRYIFVNTLLARSKKK